MTSARRLFLKRLRSSGTPTTGQSSSGSLDDSSREATSSARGQGSAPTQTVSEVCRRQHEERQHERALRRAATDKSLDAVETTNETETTTTTKAREVAPPPATSRRRSSRLFSASRRSSSTSTTDSSSGTTESASKQRDDTPPEAAMCGAGARRRSAEVPANASDYEQISDNTPHLGHVKLGALSYSNKQMVKSHHKHNAHANGGPSTVMLVENRDTNLPFYYILLRMNSKSFWSTIVGVQYFLVFVCSVIFAIIGQSPGTAIALALDANRLSVGDIECEPSKWGKDSTASCRAWAALFSLFHAVLLLFAGGVIVVRLSRVVAKRRFEFAKNAILVKNEELCVRFFSNRPSTVVMPSFRLEYFDTRGRARPLTLVNGGGVAFVHDTCLYLRHKIDAHSPFSLPNWRDEVVKVRVAVMGFDELLAQDVSGTAIYYCKDILDDAKYDDVLFRGRIRVPTKSRNKEGSDSTKLALFSDMSRLDELIYLEEEEPEEAAKPHSVAQIDAGLSADEVAQRVRRAHEDNIHRHGPQGPLSNVVMGGVPAMPRLARGLSIANMFPPPTEDNAPDNPQERTRAVDVEQPDAGNEADHQQSLPTLSNNNNLGGDWPPLTRANEDEKRERDSSSLMVTESPEEENTGSSSTTPLQRLREPQHPHEMTLTSRLAIDEIRRVPSGDDNKGDKGAQKTDSDDDEQVIDVSELPYCDRQWIRSLLNSATMPNYMVTVVTNRRRPIPWHYLFLRMRPTHFWWSIVGVVAVVTIIDGILFTLLAGQTPANAVLLSLDTHGLSVGDVECEPDAWGYDNHAGVPLCRAVAAIVRVIFFIIELFFGAMIIVRLSRVVVQCRFKFSDFAVLTRDWHTGAKELVVRIVSNRPSTLIMPTFQLEYMDAQGKRLHPLDLTNGGSTAYLSDSTFFLRHRVDPTSPFYGDDWRRTVLGVRVAVMGFDDLLAQEACGCRYYLTEQIRDDREYGDMVSLATVSYKRTRHNAYVVDMSKLNTSIPVRNNPPRHVRHAGPHENNGHHSHAPVSNNPPSRRQDAPSSSDEPRREESLVDDVLVDNNNNNAGPSSSKTTSSTSSSEVSVGEDNADDDEDAFVDAFEEMDASETSQAQAAPHASASSTSASPQQPTEDPPPPYSPRDLSVCLSV